MEEEAFTALGLMATKALQTKDKRARRDLADEIWKLSGALRESIDNQLNSAEIMQRAIDKATTESPAAAEE